MDFNKMNYEETKKYFDREGQNLYEFRNKSNLIILRVWATSEEEAKKEYNKRGLISEYRYIDIIG